MTTPPIPYLIFMACWWICGSMIALKIFAK